MLNNKYLIFLSLILNGILLIFLFGLIPFLLYLSTVTNFLLLWLLRRTYKQINETNEDMNTLFDNTSSFLEHLERIYGMEMYYGDQTLQGLIEHSREMSNEIIDFQIKYSLAEIDEESPPVKEEEFGEA
tara:strand:- start:1236 stop:1622 length:387 start_codon:yes stop_codon:yes gene_type:complete